MARTLSVLSVGLLVGIFIIVLVSEGSDAEGMLRLKIPLKTTQISNFSKGSNAFGQWGWKGTYNSTKVVVVIGVSPNNGAMVMINELISLGYIVWWREQCTYANELMYSCREFFGYATYLADVDPRKPVSTTATVFIHGHNNSWHSGYEGSIARDIDSAAKCAAKTNRFTPLNTMEVSYRWKYDRNVYTRIELWNDEIAPFLQNTTTSYNYTLNPTASIKAWQGGQWAVSPTALKLVPDGFWSFALNKNAPNSDRPMYLQIDSLFWEQFTHLIFKEPAQLDVHSRTPECRPPDDKFSNTFHKEWVDDVLSKCNTDTPVIISRYKQGIWLSGRNATVFVVIGRRIAPEESPTSTNKELVVSLVNAGYGVWIRHPESLICKQPDTTSEDCGPALGYLTFLTRFSEYDVTSPYILFLRGDEAYTPEFRFQFDSALQRLISNNVQFEHLKLPSENHPKDILYKYIQVLQLRSNWRTYVDSDYFRNKLNETEEGWIDSLPTPLYRVVTRPKATRFPRKRKVMMPSGYGAHFIVSADYINNIHSDYFGVIRDAMTQPIVVADMKIIWRVVFGMPLWEPS